MNKEFCKGIDNLLDLFEDSLSPAEILASKLMGQISSSITKERIKLNMNQTDFAAHLGVNQSQISRWEQGDYNFSIKKLAEIAAALNLDINITMLDANISKELPTDQTTQVITKTVCYSSKNVSSSLNNNYSNSLHLSKK